MAEPAPRLYFAYGSNLHMAQMAERCPDSVPVKPCVIPDKRLLFDGVLSIEDKKGCSVPGALYETSADDERKLDRYEGYPKFYVKRHTHVTIDGVRRKVYYYVFNPESYHGHNEYPPNPYYWNVCVTGYHNWRLPIAALAKAREEAIAYGLIYGGGERF